MKTSLEIMTLKFVVMEDGVCSGTRVSALGIFPKLVPV